MTERGGGVALARHAAMNLLVACRVGGCMTTRLVLPCLLASLAACGSSASSTAVDAAPAIDAAPDASTTATFSYTPSWPGVQAVAVIGAFGQATDWTTPLVTLTASGGTFTGAAQLTPGDHAYLFKVVGLAGSNT
jgi:hypothetical protein